MNRQSIPFALLVLVSMFAGLGRAGDTPVHFDNNTVIAEYNVMVAMRDGVELSTDIYRPAQPGRYPVILTRDPYDNGSDDKSIAEGYLWAERGYVFVHQNVRGRYDSDGEFYPYAAELEDGYDTQAWAGTQPWSNGKVGMLGGSYLASVQWLSAHLRADALKALAPRMTPYNYYKDVAYPGGAFQLASRIGWGTLMEGRTNQLRNYDWDSKLWHLPLKTLDTAIGHELPHFRDWIAHPDYDDYWREFDVEARVGELDVPAYNIAGWYDVFLRGNLVSFTGMRESARSDRARNGQKLIIGPWPHTADFKPQLGELDFGPESTIDLDELHLRWFDHWLKGVDSGLLNEAPVRLFVMGENRWRDEQEWPLARTVYTPYYLHGDGSLNAREPGQAGPSTNYVYDPRNPVPTLGGNLMFKTLPAGPFDQTRIGQRDDVLVYTTQPLAEDVEVTGPVSVTLYASSSAPDTDFTAKLIDVHPDGKAYNLADGIIRARYRDSFAEPVLMEPGTIYKFTIDLWATSNLFKQGHRIRVDISSSNFPRYDRNPNTGHKFGEDAEMLTAQQTIYHSRQYPSHIVLPVIPRPLEQAMSLDVSPDERTLVFDILGDLYTLSIGGGEATRITDGPAYDAQPPFSPDGKYVAFVSDRGGSSNVRLAEPMAP